MGSHVLCCHIFLFSPLLVSRHVVSGHVLSCHVASILTSHVVERRELVPTWGAPGKAAGGRCAHSVAYKVDPAFLHIPYHLRTRLRCA